MTSRGRVVRSAETASDRQGAFVLGAEKVEVAPTDRVENTPASIRRATPDLDMLRANEAPSVVT